MSSHAHQAALETYHEDDCTAMIMYLHRRGYNMNEIRHRTGFNWMVIEDVVLKAKSRANP